MEVNESQLSLDHPTLGKFQKNARETSRSAAIAVYPRTGTQRRRVLDAFIAAGERGLTDDECEVVTEVPRARTRRKELIEEHGVPIVLTNQKRRTRLGELAHVWAYILE